MLKKEEELAKLEGPGRMGSEDIADEVDALNRLAEGRSSEEVLDPAEGKSIEFADHQIVQINWQALMRWDLTSQQALVIAHDMMRLRQLPALSPYTPLDKRISVVCEIPRVYRHILFKAPGDTHGRKFPNSELEEHFQPDRAARLPWIPEVLLSPDRISTGPDRTTGGKMFFYSCIVNADEVFAVLVRQLGREFSLTTAYSFTPGDWKRKRSSLKEIHKKK